MSSPPAMRAAGAQKELWRLGVAEQGAEAAGRLARARGWPGRSDGLRPNSTPCRLRCRRSRFLLSEGSRGGVPLRSHCASNTQLLTHTMPVTEA